MMDYLPRMLNHDLLLKNVPSDRYRDGEDFAEWQRKAKEKLSSLLGLDRINRCESTGYSLEYKKEEEEYTEYRFTLESEPGYRFPCVMRVPKGVKAPMPVVLTLHGHSTGMHISLGVPIFPRDQASISGGDRDFVVRAVKEGFAAIAIEQRNFGECGGLPEGGPDCQVSSMAAMLMGRTTIGERVTDVSCVIDAVIENFNFIDRDKIILMGNSGGGTATFYAAAMDDRIALAMPSCAVCTYKDSIGAMRHCTCNFIPYIANHFDMGDIAGLIAPRKLVIVNGKDDKIFPDFGVRETYEIVERMYKAAGAPDACALVTGPEGHRFYADLAWPVARRLADI